MHRYRISSYAHADKELVDSLDLLLRSMGLDPVWDRDLHPGTRFADEIQRNIALTLLARVVSLRIGNRSGPCLTEARAARRGFRRAYTFR